MAEVESDLRGAKLLERNVTLGVAAKPVGLSGEFSNYPAGDLVGHVMTVDKTYRKADLAEVIDIAANRSKWKLKEDATVYFVYTHTELLEPGKVNVRILKEYYFKSKVQEEAFREGDVSDGEEYSII